MRANTFWPIMFFGVLFVSMLIIVTLDPLFQSRLLTIVLMFIGFILALTSIAASEISDPPRVLKSASVTANLLLRAEAMIASVIAAWLLGRDSLPLVNGWQAALLWLLILGIAVLWLQRREHSIGENIAGLIERSDSTYGVIKGSNVVSISKFLTIAARFPLYELSTEVDVGNIDAKPGHKIKNIRVRVHYTITDPEKLHNDAPNNYQVVEKLLKEQNKSHDSAKMEPAFWSQYLEKQIHSTTDDVVRECVWDSEKNALEISKGRLEFAAEVEDHLGKKVQSWGVKVTELKFETVEVDPDTEKSIKRKDPERPQREQKDAREEAEKEYIKTQRRIEIEKKWVEDLIGVLEKKEFSDETIQQIVLAVVGEQAKTNRLDEEMRRLTEIVTLMRQNDHKAEKKV